jgi:hypothetical protein
MQHIIKPSGIDNTEGLKVEQLKVAIKKATAKKVAELPVWW